jgi:hypothetical protein
MDDRPDGEELRHVLRNVAGYRALCAQVRRSSTGGLFFGGLMLFIWYAGFGQRNDYGPFSLIYLGLAGLEFTVALWNRVSPSAEGILLDGVVLLVFGVATLTRHLLTWQGAIAGPKPIPIFSLLAVYWVYSGFSTVRSYFQIRRAFTHRPSAEHLRWFNDLLREVKAADPDADPDALDLPTKPPLRGKLLGDTALFVSPGSDDPIIVARPDVVIDRLPPKEPGGPPGGRLFLGEEVGTFRLDPANWRNYAAWKKAGGEAVDGP